MIYSKQYTHIYGIYLFTLASIALLTIFNGYSLVEIFTARFMFISLTLFMIVDCITSIINTYRNTKGEIDTYSASILLRNLFTFSLFITNIYVAIYFLDQLPWLYPLLIIPNLWIIVFHIFNRIMRNRNKGISFYREITLSQNIAVTVILFVQQMSYIFIKYIYGVYYADQSNLFVYLIGLNILLFIGYVLSFIGHFIFLHQYNCEVSYAVQYMKNHVSIYTIAIAVFLSLGIVIVSSGNWLSNFSIGQKESIFICATFFLILSIMIHESQYIHRVHFILVTHNIESSLLKYVFYPRSAIVAIVCCLSLYCVLPSIKIFALAFVISLIEIYYVRRYRYCV